VLLIALTLGVIAKYVLDINGAGTLPRLSASPWLGLYVVYLVFAFDLCTRRSGRSAGWPGAARGTVRPPRSSWSAGSP